MRDQWNSRVTWSAVRWLVPLAFLALPGCDYIFTLDPPPPPQDWAIFCDIEDRNVPRRCATTQDLDVGIRIADAAVALTTRETSQIGLDYSPQAIMDEGCDEGQPVAITFHGAFPKGVAKCVKDAPAAIGPNTWLRDADHVCYLKCHELFQSDQFDPTLSAFCNQKARASTNFPPLDDDDDDLLTPYAGACTAAGMEHPSYDTDTNPDSRRLLEPARWRYVSTGVERSGPDLNTLTRTVPFAGQWDRGAATLHVITEGNGYLEFTASDTNMDRACGLSSGIYPDTDPSLDDIDFAVRLAESGGLIIHESGPAVTPFIPYYLGDRVRIKFTDNFNGTASITYHLIPAACSGPLCEGSLIHTAASPATYPLHVDASLLTEGATLDDVRLVRVKKSLF